MFSCLLLAILVGCNLVVLEAINGDTKVINGSASINGIGDTSIKLAAAAAQFHQHQDVVARRSNGGRRIQVRSSWNKLNCQQDDDCLSLSHSQCNKIYQLCQCRAAFVESRPLFISITSSSNANAAARSSGASSGNSGTGTGTGLDTLATVSKRQVSAEVDGSNTLAAIAGISSSSSTSSANKRALHKRAGPLHQLDQWKSAPTLEIEIDRKYDSRKQLGSWQANVGQGCQSSSRSIRGQQSNSKATTAAAEQASSMNISNINMNINEHINTNGHANSDGGDCNKQDTSNNIIQAEQHSSEPLQLKLQQAPTTEQVAAAETNMAEQQHQHHQELLVEQEQELRICLPIKSLDDYCLSHDQCLADNSLCLPTKQLLISQSRQQQHVATTTPDKLIASSAASSPGGSSSAYEGHYHDLAVGWAINGNHDDDYDDKKRQADEKHSRSRRSESVLNVAHTCQCRYGYEIQQGLEKHLEFSNFNLTLKSGCSPKYSFVITISMHSDLLLLTILSIVIIVIMITCFVCVVRSRHKDDQELAVQYSAMQRPGGQPPQLQTTSQLNNNQLNNLLSDSQQQQQTINGSHQSSYTTANNNQQQLVNSSNQQQQQQQQQASGSMSNAYPSSPYHQVMSSPQPQVSSNNGQPLVSSAVIGSTEAEFQNDFIQVFPMYHIAPLPEKNSTPYMT